MNKICYQVNPNTSDVSSVTFKYGTLRHKSKHWEIRFPKDLDVCVNLKIAVSSMYVLTIFKYKIFNGIKSLAHAKIYIKLLEKQIMGLPRRTPLGHYLSVNTLKC